MSKGLRIGVALLLGWLGLAYAAQAELIRVEMTGGVAFTNMSAGPFADVLEGERVRMYFDVTTPGTDVVPNVHTKYDIVLESFIIAVGHASDTLVATASGPTFDLHNDDPEFDSMAIPRTPMATPGAELEFEAVAAFEFWDTTDIIKWVTSYAYDFFDPPAYWAIEMGDESIEFTMFATHIIRYPELPPIRYEIIELGVLGGPDSGANGNATGINEQGHVVGVAEDDDWVCHAVIWRDGEIVDLGYIEEDLPYANGKGINDFDHCVGQGSAHDPNGSGSFNAPFLWTPEDGMSAVVTKFGWAWGINNSGQVAMTLDGPNGGAYFWDPVEGARRIAFPDALQGYTANAWEINNHGVVCGEMARAVDYRLHAYRYYSDTDTIVDLHEAEYFRHTVAYGLNDNGDVVGYGNLWGYYAVPVVWPVDGSGTLALLEPARDDLLSGQAEHINNHGDVVGTDDSLIGGVYNEAWIAFEALSGKPRKVLLEWLVSPEAFAEWDILYAFEINESRQIGGFGVHCGDTRAFLMNPIPSTDLDEDGDVDFDDFGVLVGCLSGPDVPHAPDCKPADLDWDGDVDLRDYARFAKYFTPSE